MIKTSVAETLKEQVNYIMGKNLSTKDVIAILNAHTNSNDSLEMMIEQLKDRKRRGLVPDYI